MSNYKNIKQRVPYLGIIAALLYLLTLLLLCLTTIQDLNSSCWVYLKTADGRSMKIATRNNYRATWISNDYKTVYVNDTYYSVVEVYTTCNK